jgi:hypothetical protein
MCILLLQICEYTYKHLRDELLTPTRYLTQQLNLLPFNASTMPSNITLHDLENALSRLVADMFWTRELAHYVILQLT